MKPIYLEKSLGIDLREESVALVFLGKQLRTIDELANHFFETEPLSDDNPDAERRFLDEINRFMMNQDLDPQNHLNKLYKLVLLSIVPDLL